jgi:branched-subunit amino acid aminotransferase/4-amino-4-deoxychorismate lyase
VLELAASRQVPVHEREMPLAALSGAEEAFLTNSFRGIAPLVRLDGRSIGAGAPGPVTRGLLSAYADLIARECGA